MSNLSAARFEGHYNGLSSAAKKVYDAVPISEPWDAAQIHQEMIRLGCGSDLRSTTGCLNTLVEASMVIERPRGNFRRAIVKPKKAPMATQGLMSIVPTAPVSAASELTPPTPEEILSALSTRCMELATDIDDAAVAIKRYTAAREADSQKLKQLQALLKGS